MQNPIQKFRQNSIVLEKLGILSEKLKTFKTIIEFNNFFWNFSHVSYLPMPGKGCLEFFYFV